MRIQSLSHSAEPGYSFKLQVENRYKDLWSCDRSGFLPSDSQLVSTLSEVREGPGDCQLESDARDMAFYRLPLHTYPERKPAVLLNQQTWTVDGFLVGRGPYHDRPQRHPQAGGARICAEELSDESHGLTATWQLN